MRNLAFDEQAQISGGRNIFEQFGDALRKNTYDLKREGTDGYNLYRHEGPLGLGTGKYWVGTPDRPRQCWVKEPTQIAQALNPSTTTFGQFCPA